jgi:hypothetical protein
MTAAAQPTIQKAKVTPNLPANYDEELAAEALAMQKRIGAPSGDLIRVNKDKTFSLPSGETAPVLSVVIACFVSMNQYYEGKYDPKNIQPPVCMAIGQEIALMKPFETAPKVQNTDCHTCWANQWGTDGKGKACKNQRLLAVLAPGAQADGPLMILKVSPTGTRFWDNYVTQAIALAGALIKIVTEVSFDQNSDYASLRFKIQKPNENWHDAFPRRVTALERLLTEPDFAPAEVATKPGGKK